MLRPASPSKSPRNRTPCGLVRADSVYGLHRRRGSTAEALSAASSLRSAVRLTPTTAYTFSLDDMPTTPKFVARSRARKEDQEAGAQLSSDEISRALHASVRTPVRLRLGSRGDSAANTVSAALEADATGEGVVARRWREWRGGAAAVMDDGAWEEDADAVAINEGQLDALLEEFASRKTRSVSLANSLDALEKELRVKDTAQKSQRHKEMHSQSTSRLLHNPRNLRRSI